jgi:hypothetical protein
MFGTLAMAGPFGIPLGIWYLLSGLGIIKAGESSIRAWKKMGGDEKLSNKEIDLQERMLKAESETSERMTKEARTSEDKHIQTILSMNKEDRRSDMTRQLMSMEQSNQANETAMMMQLVNSLMETGRTQQQPPPAGAMNMLSLLKGGF